MYENNFCQFIKELIEIYYFMLKENVAHHNKTSLSDAASKTENVLRDISVTHSNGGQQRKELQERKKEKMSTEKKQRENREQFRRSFTGMKPEAEAVRCK